METLPKISGGLPKRFTNSFVSTVLLKGLGDRARIQGRALPDLAFLVRKKRVVRGKVPVISLQPPQTREALWMVPRI
jgi:hypothetical protein